MIIETLKPNFFDKIYRLLDHQYRLIFFLSSSKTPIFYGRFEKLWSANYLPSKIWIKLSFFPRKLIYSIPPFSIEHNTDRDSNFVDSSVEPSHFWLTARQPASPASLPTFGISFGDNSWLAFDLCAASSRADSRYILIGIRHLLYIESRYVVRTYICVIVTWSGHIAFSLILGRTALILKYNLTVYQPDPCKQLTSITWNRQWQRWYVNLAFLRENWSQMFLVIRLSSEQAGSF